jgi:hypothetical protein
MIDELVLSKWLSPARSAQQRADLLPLRSPLTWAREPAIARNFIFQFTPNKFAAFL